jgi:hypothetical protein
MNLTFIFLLKFSSKMPLDECCLSCKWSKNQILSNRCLYECMLQISRKRKRNKRWTKSKKKQTCATISDDDKLEARIINGLLIGQSLHRKEKSIYIEFWNYDKKVKKLKTMKKNVPWFRRVELMREWRVKKRESEGLYFKGFRIWVWPLLASG